MSWYNENPVKMKDADAKVAIARYDDARTSSAANPLSHTFGVAMVGPFVGKRVSEEQRKKGDYPVGVRFHRALTADDEEILIGCGVTNRMIDVPGTYFYGAIVNPSK